MLLELTFAELRDRLQTAYEAERLNQQNGLTAIVLTDEPAEEQPNHWPQCPVLYLSDQRSYSPIVDIAVANGQELDQTIAGIEQSPVASCLLIQLLRHNERTSIEEGLFAESLTYSALQHGEQFTHWLASHQRKPAERELDDPPILLARTRNTLQVTLNRPQKRNAWSIEMRDGLTEALHLLETDPTLQDMHINAAGPAFGAGGDLDEFGLARDAALAHLTRSIRNPGLLLWKQSDQVTVHLHGACVGAGIEVPAFAGWITAAETTFCLLPEVAFGLIPGAGGTVSILRRIGRQRLGWMAIGGQRISATTAHEWGLIDEIRY